MAIAVRMRRYAAAAILLVSGLSHLAGDAAAQQKNTKDALIGHWTLVSLKANQDGRTLEAYGPNPIGILLFDAQGRFSTQVMRSDLPKFAANNRLQGTPEENKAIVSGFIAYFGTYTVSEPGTINLHIEWCSYPNFNGADHKRTFVINGDEMEYTNPTTTFGAAFATLIWKRTPRAGTN